MTLAGYVARGYVELLKNVRFEVFTVVTMKKDVFWDVAQCRNCVNRRFGVTYQAGSLADFFLSSTLKMGAIRSSETSVNTIYTAPHPRRLLSS
jgi:hypothetical protein